MAQERCSNRLISRFVLLQDRCPQHPARRHPRLTRQKLLRAEQVPHPAHKRHLPRISFRQSLRLDRKFKSLAWMCELSSMEAEAQLLSGTRSTVAGECECRMAPEKCLRARTSRLFDGKQRERGSQQPSLEFYSCSVYCCALFA